MMLIDWLTLRLPMLSLDRALYERVMSNLDLVTRIRPDGSRVYAKYVLDVEKLRSDSGGLFWSLGCDGKQSYLVIAGSPASIMNDFRNNVFGSLDVVQCAKALILYASRSFDSNLPLDLDRWQCRRIDITGNYLLPDSESVELALSQLLVSNATRKRAASPSSGGNSVYWGGKSQRARGKAYWKGDHVRYLMRKGKFSVPDGAQPLLDRILRLEHTRGSQFFRTKERNPYFCWYEYLSPETCKTLFLDYFTPLFPGSLEVNDMNSQSLVSLIMKENSISEGRARAAYNTLRNMRSDGFDVVKSYMPRSTFGLHLKYLRKIGIADSDIQVAKIIPIRKIKIILAQPVSSWDELKKVA